MSRKMKVLRHVSTVLLPVAIVLSLVVACGAEQPAKETPEPEKATTLGLEYDASKVAVGDEVEVVMQVANVKDLYGVALDLVYDPAVYKYISASKGDFLSSDGKNNNFAAALEDGFEGRLVMGVSRVGEVKGVAGTGAVMTARFEVLCKDCGDKEFKLEKTFLKNPSLVEVLFLSSAGGKEK